MKAGTGFGLSSGRLGASMGSIRRGRPKGYRCKGVFAAGLLAVIVGAPLLLLPGHTTWAGTAIPFPQEEKPPAGNLQNGKKLFTSYGCFECHGHQAQGTVVVGPRLGPNPISFPSFSKYVRQPTGQMPPFTAKVTSEADLADIYAFLQSLPQPPKADSIPALK